MHTYRRLFIGLEEAYLASRYLFRVYEEDESRELVEFAKRVIEFVKGLGVEAGNG